MDKADIPFLPASQLSQLIQDRTVSPVEAVEAYLDRIDELKLQASRLSDRLPLRGPGSRPRRGNGPSYAEKAAALCTAFPLPSRTS